jgi:hypothetical protein
MDWIIVRNTGDRAFLERGLELTEVDRPRAMSQSEFRAMLAPDSSVDDVTIANVTQGFR